MDDHEDVILAIVMLLLLVINLIVLWTVFGIIGVALAASIGGILGLVT